MRPVWVVVAFLGCAGGAASLPPPADPGATTKMQLAEDDVFKPSYGKPELQTALIAERGAEATAERLVTDLEARDRDPGADDRLRVARADLAVRRRFIASLEACESVGTPCPPRLDDPAWSYDPDPDGPLPAPKIDAALRFDLASWQNIAAELHGRACACRTSACVESVSVVIDSLEARPAADVQGDEVSSLSITRARECLFRLRGRTATPGARPLVED
jgi:hypothetical protein